MWFLLVPSMFAFSGFSRSRERSGALSLLERSSLCRARSPSVPVGLGVHRILAILAPPPTWLFLCLPLLEQCRWWRHAPGTWEQGLCSFGHRLSSNCYSRLTWFSFLWGEWFLRLYCSWVARLDPLYWVSHTLTPVLLQRQHGTVHRNLESHSFEASIWITVFSFKIYLGEKRGQDFLVIYGAREGTQDPRLVKPA